MTEDVEMKPQDSPLKAQAKIKTLDAYFKPQNETSSSNPVIKNPQTAPGVLGPIPNGNHGVITPMKTESSTNKDVSEEKNGKILSFSAIFLPHLHFNKIPNHIVTANTNAAVD